MASPKWILSVVAILTLGGCAHAQKDPHKANYQSEGFIRVQDGRFVDENCKEFFFTGWNSWALVDKASYIVRYPAEVTRVINGKNFIEHMMDEARDSGFNMIRLFGHAVRKFARFQTSPGVYDENTFKGMDYIIDEAGKRGIKLIISFSTNWGKIDSKRQFVQWDKRAKIEDAFWVKKSIRKMYMNHIEAILTRKNTYNGLEYRDDPNIFAWNIFNEMRCYAGFCHTQQAGLKWNKEMAKFIKSIDQNHLLTIGSEGFYSWGCPTGPASFPLDESHATGQDFLRDSAIPEVDFAAIHMWPDNWAISDLKNWPLQWVQQHSKDSEEYIKKPMVLEEFGIETEKEDGARRERRDPVFKKVFKEVEKSLKTSGGIRAAMFWEWFVSDEGDLSIHGVTKGHSTWNLVMDHTKKIAKLNAKGGTVENCEPGRSSAKVKSVLPDNQYQIKGCCDDGCNPKYADYRGETFQESIVASAGECCRACKFANIRARSQVCSGWSWCPCGKCGTAEKNTCWLKSAKNPFYPTYWKSGKGQPWISGSLGNGDKEFPAWKCQPSGTCAYNEECKNFKESILCPDGSCGAAPFDIWSTKDVLVLSTNGQERPYSDTNPPDVTTAAECCGKCKKTEGCNGWRFCPKEAGCSIYRKPCNEWKDKLGLGPHEECSPGGTNYPRFMCTLLKVDTTLLNPSLGTWNEYVSGVLQTSLSDRASTGK